MYLVKKKYSPIFIFYLRNFVILSKALSKKKNYPIFGWLPPKCPHYPWKGLHYPFGGNYPQFENGCIRLWPRFMAKNILPWLLQIFRYFDKGIEGAVNSWWAGDLWGLYILNIDAARCRNGISIQELICLKTWICLIKQNALYFY